MTEIIKLDSNETITKIAIFNGMAYLAGQVPDDFIRASHN